MGSYSGSLRIRGSFQTPLDVEVDLTEERIAIRSYDTVIGDWALGEVLISGREDGFHLRIDGEEAIVDLTDDVGFALEIGLQSASPRLRRRMGAALKEAQARQSGS